jgi:hypothetical protein
MFKVDEAQKKIRPTLQDFYNWALDQINAYILVPYSTENLLEMEFQVFKCSPVEQTKEMFLTRLLAIQGRNQETFDINSQEVQAFISRNFPEYSPEQK